MGRTSNSKITTVEMYSRDFLLTLHTTTSSKLGTETRKGNLATVADNSLN